MRKYVLTAILVLIASGAQAGVIVGPIFNPATGSSYYLLDQGNWTSSENEAVSLGGHLVTINDQAENDWVFETFAGYGGVDRLLWIGLTDQTNTEFEWISADPVTFTNWDTGEPNTDFEDFVYMYPDNVIGGGLSRDPGKWNNYSDLDTEFSGTTPLYGVVEVIPEPTTAVLLGLGLVGLSMRARG